MALAYTAPTWEDGTGTGISASQLQAMCNCIEGLVQGSDKAIHMIAMTGSLITLTFADGTQETVNASELKGIVSITKTGESGNVDTYTITYTDGSTSTFTVTNGMPPDITVNATADALSSDNPTVTVTKTGTDEEPVFSMAFSGLKGAQGERGPEGPAGSGDMDTEDYDPQGTVATAGGIASYVTSAISGKADDSELDVWSTQSQVSSGSITFSGINDTNNNGYKLYINVDANSTEKNPTSEITAISGTGTSNMSITFSTNADNGAYGKLRILK